MASNAGTENEWRSILTPTPRRTASPIAATLAVSVPDIYITSTSFLLRTSSCHSALLLPGPRDEQTAAAPSDEAAGTAAGGAEDADGGQVFKRGIVYRGVYCPSLSNSFMEDHLELAYQRYSHRQRQKSLIIVNLVDSLLKIVLATVTAGVSHYLRSLLCSSV
jgi:hypothetical protein